VKRVGAIGGKIIGEVVWRICGGNSGRSFRFHRKRGDANCCRSPVTSRRAGRSTVSKKL